MMLQTYNIFFIFSIIFPTFALSGRIKQQEGTKMKQIIIADNQDITRAGLLHVLSRMGEVSCQVAAGKSELMYRLKACPEAVVILDYTLFDFSGAADLLVLGQRYPLAHLVLWSEELSVGFIRSVVSASGLVSVLMKDAKLPEIEQCLDYVLHGRRFLCQHAAGLLLTPAETPDRETVKLTKTETEILKEIALGMTTREIAEKRFSSFHTVNTHRKNIFRKLGVNSVHEAMRYAMRSGLVDAADYCI
ncbi:transcriptional regulator, LuxR family [Prevotella multiformis DSM 16608]|uniref:Transcriptional regulator, LuxR family n=2 Tax=Prevotella multiformis TaxID=282402 RepID=F0FAS3_9BACT|nr:transcriptional regulator, LuxR family [Prevotella multiformis DSM 16608]